jgi:outer membrane protein assembly factor BamB
VTEDRGAPLTWSATENVAWKAPLVGTGTSNPIVWQDCVFLTASSGRDQGELHVICFDRDSGRERWHQTLWGTAPTLFYPKNGMAGPSPITDGKNLWAFFASGDVFCFDLDGGLLWQRSLAEEYGPFENRFAATSSPLLYEGLLIVQCDHYGSSYLVAIDAATGANRWKADRPDAWLSWSSPQLVPVADTEEPAKHELVVCGSEQMHGYDPRSGERLWTVRGLARECVPTPVLAGGLIISDSGPNGVHIAVRPGGRGDVTDTHVVWRNERNTSFVPSPIVVGPRYYLAEDKGILSCLDVKTGDMLWRKRLGGKFTASPVAVAGRIYFTDEAGVTLVVDAAAEEFTELARNEIGEDVHASSAVAQGRFFLRTAKHLVCLKSE